MKRATSPGAFWNERFGSEDMVYGFGPNAFFAAQLAKLSPGRILLPGDGEGRNATHAAEHGWSVRSFDASSVGVQKALALAKQKKVRIEAELGDAEDWMPGEQFDVVALCYLHLSEDVRHNFHRRAAQWLKPGGTLLLEGFGPGQLALNSGGPKSLPMLFTTAMLSSDFSGLNASVLVTEKVVLDEGPHHQGAAEVTRLVAHRPA